MKNVLVDVEVHPQGLRRLQAIPGIQVRLADAAKGPRTLPSKLIENIHVLFCNYPPSNFEEMRSLELVQLASAGYSQLYALPLLARGVRACNGRGIFDTPIGEWNMAMMVNLARNLRTMIRHQEAGVWDRSSVFQTEIRGRTVGIWGYGGIGRETARLAKAFGMTVHVLTRKGVGPVSLVYQVPGTGDAEGQLPDKVYRYEDTPEFLSRLDFLVLSMPLTRTTEGIVGEQELRALPRSAFVLNPARGPIIKEEALLKALRQTWIAGAALDAHYLYPMPADHPLWRFPNVIMTPHVSGSDKAPYYQERSWDILLSNVERFLDGRQLLNELSASQLRGE